jgi:hypothetical protein
MTPAEVAASVVDLATSDLVALVKTIVDLIEQRANAASLVDASVRATEIAADVAEEAKFGPKP